MMTSVTLLRANAKNDSYLQVMVALMLGTALAAPLPAFAAPAKTKASKQAEKKADAKAENATVMPTVTVTGARDGVVGYHASTTRSATRTDTPLINVPQAVSVVTKQQIRDQNVQSIGEAIRYVPGIVTHQGEANRDQVTIRGNSSSADFFIDGMRDDAQYIRDLYNIERVEVLKGPNALAFGRGGSGGVVNRAGKMAEFTPIRQSVLSAGSYGHTRLQADVGDRVSEDAALRLNSVFEHSDSYRQYGDMKRYGVNPTATFNVGERTTVQTGYEYFHDDRFNDRGIPSYAGLAYYASPKAFFGDPTKNTSEASVNSGFVIVTHEFSDSLSLRHQTRYIDNNKFYENVYPGSAVNAAGNFTLVGYNNKVARETFSNQTDVTKKFETSGLRHTLVSGMEITQQDTDVLRQTAFFNNATTSLTVPTASPITYTNITFRPNGTDGDSVSKVRVYGLYMQDQVEINRYLQILGGVRYDRFDIDYSDARSGANLSRDDGLVSPRAGIVVKPLENVSVYTSYSVSYLPSSGDQFASLTAQSQGLKPEKMENFEVGTKWDVRPDLSLTAAVYQLDRDNTRANAPNNAGVVVPTGQSRTEGVELGVTGQITPAWQMTGGYALQSASYTSATTSAREGARVPLVPMHMASLWNKYDVTKEWAGALGIIHQTDQFANVDNSVRLKGFTRFDAAVFYNLTEQHRLQLNVENVLNRRYIQTAHDNNNITPGSPVAFRLSLTSNF